MRLELTISLRFFMVASVFFLCGCATDSVKKHQDETSVQVVPSVAQDSKTYQYAVARAFADLQQRRQQRNPASETEKVWWHEMVGSGLKHNHEMEVLVFPKLMQMGQNPDDPDWQLHFDKALIFSLTFLGLEKCEHAKEWLPISEIKDCHVVDIKPERKKGLKRQMVRVYFDGEDRVYGLSYHPYDDRTHEFAAAVKKVRWDPSEPLSSELLMAGHEMTPIDLPLYASNLLQAPSAGKIVLGTEIQNQLVAELKKMGLGFRSCEGWNFHYRNSYGSDVSGGWCTQDKWPTLIETHRYVAILKSALTSEGIEP